jgi:aminomethyltransferase
LRLGVAEMTRFGMGPGDFAEVAALMAAVVNDRAAVSSDVKALRSRFTELGYCFTGPGFDPLIQRLHELI